MANEIGFKKISQIISSDRFNGVVHYRTIYNVIKLLLTEISYSLGNDVPVTIKNFGTLSLFIIKGHKVLLFNDKKLSNDTKIVKFRPHDTFVQMILQYKDNLKKD